MEKKIEELRIRIHKLQEKDPVGNSNIIHKLQRKIRQLSK